MATVLIPWRASGPGPHRERAMRWVWDRWRQRPYGHRVCEMPVPTTRRPDGRLEPWCKAAAVMPHVADADEIVIVADADCWTDGVPAAAAAVEAGADWAVPHQKVHRLTEQATDYLLAGCQVPASLAIEKCPVNGDEPYSGFHGGGIVVVRRDVLLEVPFDPRFIGWGGEDASWRDAMLTLIGSPWCGRDPLFHLWHPPQPRISRKVGSRESAALRTRYVRANRKPNQMRALLAEIERNT